MDQQPLMQGGYPPPGAGYPPPGAGYPPPGEGYPPPGAGYPPPGAGYPPQAAYPPPAEMQGTCGMGGVGRVGAASKLIIKQKVNLLEMAGDTMSGTIPCIEMCLERPNEYEIFDATSGAKLLVAKEDSDFCCRCCCNPNHELKLHITDPSSGSEVMIVDRPFKCAGGCPAWLSFCQQEATLYSGNNPENPSAILGKTLQPTCGGLCTPTVTAMGPGEQEFAHIEGPTCCFGGATEFCCDQEFGVSRQTGKAGDVAKIVKEKPEDLKQAATELMTDSDLFTLTFNDPGLQQNQKLTLLSSVLLLDYMFFEQNQPFECDPISQSCSITCCNMYICGMLLPCKCKCGGGNEEGGE